MIVQQLKTFLVVCLFCRWLSDAFVKRCKVENFDAKSIATAPPLYIRNTASDRCCIILTGHVKIVAGEEGFESECGSWTILGLSATQHRVYMPDFTAKVKGPDNARIMYITNSEFRTFIQGKRVPRRSFDQSFGDGNTGPLGVRRQRRTRAAKSPATPQGERSSPGAAKSPSGRSSPASSYSEEDDQGEEAMHSNVARLETVTSPRITPARAPDSGRSPPLVALPSPRPSEPSIFRLHSVEKDPYAREHALQASEQAERERLALAAGDDSRSTRAPGSGQHHPT